MIDFNDASALGVEAFGGATALPSVQTDPDSVDQSMLQLQKPSGAEVWAGVTLAEVAAGSDLTADGTVPVTMKVNAPVAGVLTLKLETSDGTSVEIPQNVVVGWQELSFDVSNAPTGIVKAVLFPDLNDTAAAQTYFIDDVTFPTATIVQPPADPMTSGPVAPTHDATTDGVVSLFSDTYTDVTAGTWRSQYSNGSDHSIVDLSGNEVHKYQNMNFAIIENFAQIDASAKNTFHVTIWRTGDAADAVIGVKLVDYPSGSWTGSDPEHEFTFDLAAVPTGQWTTLALPLSAATGLTTSANIAQVIISSKVPNPDFGNEGRA